MGAHIDACDAAPLSPSHCPFHWGERESHPLYPVLCSCALGPISVPFLCVVSYAVAHAASLCCFSVLHHPLRCATSTPCEPQSYTALSVGYAKPDRASSGYFATFSKSKSLANVRRARLRMFREFPYFRKEAIVPCELFLANVRLFLSSLCSPMIPRARADTNRALDGSPSRLRGAR